MRQLPEETYEKMLKHYDNKCAICRQPEKRKSRTEGKICRLTIDHCHTTNEIRGLLCHACNVFIGHARDSVDLLKAGIEYLENAKCWREAS